MPLVTLQDVPAGCCLLTYHMIDKPSGYDMLTGHMSMCQLVIKCRHVNVSTGYKM